MFNWQMDGLEALRQLYSHVSVMAVMAGRLGLVRTIDKCTHIGLYQHGDSWVADFLHGESKAPRENIPGSLVSRLLIT